MPATGALSFWKVQEVSALAAEEQLPARVFVYGTLKRGHGAHRFLEAGHARFLGCDKIKGTMHNYGHFPAVSLEGQDTIHGEIYEVSAETLEHLDLFEGVPRFYQRTRVRMSTGKDAWVYVMDEERLTGKKVVASGRWEQRQ